MQLNSADSYFPRLRKKSNNKRVQESTGKDSLQRYRSQNKIFLKVTISILFMKELLRDTPSCQMLPPKLFFFKMNQVPLCNTELAFPPTLTIYDIIWDSSMTNLQESTKQYHNKKETTRKSKLFGETNGIENVSTSTWWWWWWVCNKRMKKRSEGKKNIGLAELKLECGQQVNDMVNYFCFYCGKMGDLLERLVKSVSPNLWKN